MKKFNYLVVPLAIALFFFISVALAQFGGSGTSIPPPYFSPNQSPSSPDHRFLVKSVSLDPKIHSETPKGPSTDPVKPKKKKYIKSDIILQYFGGEQSEYIKYPEDYLNKYQLVQWECNVTVKRDVKFATVPVSPTMEVRIIDSNVASFKEKAPLQSGQELRVQLRSSLQDKYLPQLSKGADCYLYPYGLLSWIDSEYLNARGPETKGATLDIKKFIDSSRLKELGFAPLHYTLKRVKGKLKIIPIRRIGL